MVTNALAILGAACGFFSGGFTMAQIWATWDSPVEFNTALLWLGVAIVLFAFGGLVALGLREGHAMVAAALLLLAGALPLAGLIASTVVGGALMPAFTATGVLAGVPFIAGAGLDIRPISSGAPAR